MSSMNNSETLGVKNMILCLQVSQQLKERESLLQKMVTNMEGLILEDSETLGLTITFLCQLAGWLCLQLAGPDEERYIEEIVMCEKRELKELKSLKSKYKTLAEIKFDRD